ncbi:MAG: hypothetical protein GY838_05610 [bacterium]|nr:hypothetical protein [bacterium]
MTIQRRAITLFTLLVTVGLTAGGVLAQENIPPEPPDEAVWMLGYSVAGEPQFPLINTDMLGLNDWRLLKIPDRVLVEKLQSRPDLAGLLKENCPDCLTVEKDRGTWIYVPPSSGVPTGDTFHANVPTIDDDWEAINIPSLACGLPNWLEQSESVLDAILKRVLTPEELAAVESELAKNKDCPRENYQFKILVLNQELPGGQP